MTYFQYSNDPFLDAFSQLMITILIIIAILYAVFYAFFRLLNNKEGQGKGKRKSDGEKKAKRGKASKSGKDKNRSVWFWVGIVFVVLFFLSIYFKMALDRVKVVKDQAIRERYAWLYNYSSQQFTSPMYQSIYKIVSGVAVIFNLGLMFGSKGGGYQEVV